MLIDSMSTNVTVPELADVANVQFSNRLDTLPSKSISIETKRELGITTNEFPTKIETVI